MRSIIIALASAGYVGYMPIASGTFGTLVAIPIFWAAHSLLGGAPILYTLAVAVAVAAACWIAGEAESAFGEHDSGKIVIDEVVGYLAATLLVAPTWTNTIAAFLVFRAFDVLKPFPAGYIDKNVGGGAGVVLDDVVAGLYSNLVLQILIFLAIL